MTRCFVVRYRLVGEFEISSWIDYCTVGRLVDGRAGREGKLRYGEQEDERLEGLHSSKKK